MNDYRNDLRGDDGLNFYRGLLNIAYFYGIMFCLGVAGYGIWRLVK